MAQQQTPYSYTERKRIRKSFGKRESVLKVPYLLTMQKESYVAFLQKDVPPQKRKPEGLQAAFLSAFPIVSHNGFVEMKFIEFNMAKPAFDTRECQVRGLTYAAAVRAKLQMIIYDRESPQAKTVKEIKEQEVYMGEVPLMTDYGSFIVNGTERVIVIHTIKKHLVIIKYFQVYPCGFVALRFSKSFPRTERSGLYGSVFSRIPA